MVTWRAVGAGIVELVETPPKLDRRPRRMGTLGVADPDDGGTWRWRILGMADSGDGRPKPTAHHISTAGAVNMCGFHHQSMYQTTSYNMSTGNEPRNADGA